MVHEYSLACKPLYLMPDYLHNKPVDLLIDAELTADDFNDDTLGRSLDEATKLLRDVRAGKGTVGRLFTDDTLFKEVTAFVEGAERLTNALNEGKGTLGKLLNDPAAHTSLVATLDDLSAITASLRRGDGSVGALLKDDAFARSLSATTANLEQVTARLTRGDGTIGKAMTDPSLYNRLNFPVDIYVPGCPPDPIVLLNGILRAVRG